MNDVVKIKLNINGIITIDNIGDTDNNYILTSKNNSEDFSIQHIPKDEFSRTYVDKSVELITDYYSVTIYIHTPEVLDKFLKNSEITFIYKDNTEAVYTMSDYINISNLTSNSRLQMNKVMMYHSISETLHIFHYRKFVNEYKMLIFVGHTSKEK